MLILKVTAVIITGVIAVGAMFVCQRNEFQIDRQLRIILFCTGALGFFCVMWLSIPEPFWTLFWFKLLGGLAGGYSWAYVIPERLKS